MWDHSTVSLVSTMLKRRKWLLIILSREKDLYFQQHSLPVRTGDSILHGLKKGLGFGIQTPKMAVTVCPVPSLEIDKKKRFCFC